MTKPAMICMGDLHLSHLIWSRHRDIKDDALVAFEELITRTLDLQIPLVLVGDLNDSVNPPSDIVKFIRGQFDRLAEKRIPVFFIDGNHDKRPEPWGSAIHDWPIHIGHGGLTEINGITAVGLDYDLKIEIEAKLAALTNPSKPQVLFLHQAVKQGLGFQDAWNCDLDWVPDGIPLVVMGDIHGPAEYKLRDGGKALYTGSTHPRSTSEIGPKSFVVVNDDLTYERIPFYTQRLIIHKVVPDEGVVDEDYVLNELQNDTNRLPPVVWLNYGVDRSLQVDDLALTVANRFPRVIFVKELRRFSTGSSIETDVQTNDMPTIPQLIDRVINPTSDAFANALVKALAEPKANPQEVIAAYKAKYLASLGVGTP